MTAEEQAFAALIHAVDAVYLSLGILSAGLSAVAMLVVVLALRNDRPSLLGAGVICGLAAAILGLVWIAQGSWPCAVLQAIAVPAVLATVLLRRRLRRYRSARPPKTRSVPPGDVITAG